MPHSFSYTIMHLILFHFSPKRPTYMQAGYQQALLQNRLLRGRLAQAKLRGCPAGMPERRRRPAQHRVRGWAESHWGIYSWAESFRWWLLDRSTQRAELRGEQRRLRVSVLLAGWQPIKFQVWSYEFPRIAYSVIYNSIRIHNSDLKHYVVPFNLGFIYLFMDWN